MAKNNTPTPFSKVIYRTDKMQKGSTKLETFEEEHAVKKYIDWLITHHLFDNKWCNPIQDVLKDSFKVLDQNYSLRSVERICTKIATYCLIRNEGEFVFDKHTVNANQPGELFDLAEDPDEDRNLVNDPAYVSVVKELLEAFESRMAPRLNQEKYDHCFNIEKTSQQSLNKV